VANLTFGEVVQLLMSLGVLSGGLGLAKWGLSVEKRLTRLEFKVWPKQV